MDIDLLSIKLQVVSQDEITIIVKKMYCKGILLKRIAYLWHTDKRHLWNLKAVSVDKINCGHNCL